MSVGLAEPEWNDDWKHAGDKTEPPETVEDERTCCDCYHWDRCPCGCHWGLCHNRVNEFMHEDESCDKWEEC